MTMADDPWTVPSLPWIEEIDMFVWQRELVYPFFLADIVLIFIEMTLMSPTPYIIPADVQYLFYYITTILRMNYLHRILTAFGLEIVVSDRVLIVWVVGFSGIPGC